MAHDGLDRRLDALFLRNARALERVGEADAGDVGAGDEARRRVELVEQLLGDPPDQVLAEIRDLGILVDTQHAIRLAHARDDRVPVVRM